MTTTNDLKRNAARRSVEYVKDGMRVGLGTGSTAQYMLEALGERVQKGLRIIGVPTSKATDATAKALGIPLGDLSEPLDLAIDGADEVDFNFQLIKGGGGALLREKVVATAARRMIVIAEDAKRVEILGKFKLPLEIIGFARYSIEREIQAWGVATSLRMFNGLPFLTDEGHQILDCSFNSITEPRELASRLDSIVGVVEHGLFVDFDPITIMGTAHGVVVTDRQEARPSDSGRSSDVRRDD